MNGTAHSDPRRNDASLERIIAEIFKISNSKIEESRREPIRNFIKTTINGDDAQAELTIAGNLRKDRSGGGAKGAILAGLSGGFGEGILVYILTDQRFIKVEIDDKEITSASFFLSAMTGVERKLIDGNKASIQVSFQNGSVGLRYSATNQTISDFFQKVDQARTV